MEAGIYVLNSPVSLVAFSIGAGAKQRRTARRDLRLFQAARVLALFVVRRERRYSQGSALLQALQPAPGFRRKLVLGRGWALLT